MKLSVKIFIGFAFIILFAILSFWINHQLSEEINKNTDFLTTSESIIQNSVQIHKRMIEMQSGFRGFLLTENTVFLHTYYKGLKEIPPLIEQQRFLIANSPGQLEKMDSIVVLHNKWVEYADALIEAKQKRINPNLSDMGEYDFLFNSKLQKEVGKKLNDMIGEIFNAFDHREYQVRHQRRERLNASIENTRKVTFTLAVITITIGVVAGIYLTYLISRRISKMVGLAERISKGQFEVIEDKANDELTNLSVSLSVMSQKLNKSFSDLERKNRELDQFAYVVSHDLKAPLRGMYNIINWVEEDYGEDISKELRKYFEMLKGRIQRLENLITGLLEYARVGRTINPHEDVDVAELLAEINELIIPPGYNLVIKGEMPHLHTEKLRLQQVFMNLISNAVKYHGGEKGNIEVNCADRDRYYQFSVADDGIGIAPEYHDKIFGMFQTLRERNETESTGVGLAIVKKIIEERKGFITVESEPGSGASFTFTWPKETVSEMVESD